LPLFEPIAVERVLEQQAITQTTGADPAPLRASLGG